MDESSGLALIICLVWPAIETLVTKEKVVQVDQIRVFIPSKDYETSKSFYQALGFKMDYVSDDPRYLKMVTVSSFYKGFITTT
ncbi:hypothetical protein [Pseudoalteromonas luteoviolacea]|uniref:hypothetical protein n=1 Tax=Pseudoalteromonas luteoviolacea TaxID=43657 RepID=UPI0031455E4A